MRKLVKAIGLFLAAGAMQLATLVISIWVVNIVARTLHANDLLDLSWLKAALGG